ncbi:MAG: Sec-independent protein translocase subunit TatA/TatB [Paludibacteraceae bacterium]|jgi:sec-independent protein translocase protein TatA
MKLLMIGGSEIIFIVILVLLLFGGKKIPELMKGLGKGVRSFKDGMSGKYDDEEETKKDVKAETLSNTEKIDEQKH